MPVAQKFMSRGVGNGFPLCPTKIDVSVFDFWTSLSGWSKVDEPASDALKAESIAKSLKFAMKLFWNYNGHTVDFDLGSILLTIDIEQGDFDGGTVTAPFEPKDRVCNSNGWRVFREVGVSITTDLEVDILPRRMYNGSTDDEDNFVGYGVASSAFEATDVNSAFRFFFSSYRDNDEPTEPWTFEYSDALEDMWFVASAEANSGSTSIVGLEATFSGTTITYQDFDFWTYP